MTRKDYKALADALVAASIYSGDHRDVWRSAITVATLYIADALEAANPNFDRQRFLAACKPRED